MLPPISPLPPYMPRRKKSSINPLVVAGAVAVVALGAGSLWFFKKKATDGFEGVSRLSLSDYLNNPASTRSNVYQIDAKVTRQLKWTDAGRLFAVTAKDSSGDSEDVSVFFPEKFAKESIQVGQEFTLKVEVQRDTVLKVVDMKRS